MELAMGLIITKQPHVSRVVLLFDVGRLQNFPMYPVLLVATLTKAPQDSEVLIPAMEA
jgi:hypothetical protein